MGVRTFDDCGRDGDGVGKFFDAAAVPDDVCDGLDEICAGKAFGVAGAVPFDQGLEACLRGPPAAGGGSDPRAGELSGVVARMSSASTPSMARRGSSAKQGVACTHTHRGAPRRRRCSFTGSEPANPERTYDELRRLWIQGEAKGTKPI